MIGCLGRITADGRRQVRSPRVPGLVLLILFASVLMSAESAPSASGSTPSAPGPTPGHPAASGAISVPATIDATGATDVSAALNAFVRGLPDGSTIVFKAGGTYKLGEALHLTDRHNLVFNGNGSTLRMAGCDVEDSAFLLDGIPSTGITISKFTMIGDNSGGGTTSAYIPLCESSMGVAIYGARDIDIANVTISSVHGECVYIDAGGNPRGTTPWSDGITFRDSTCQLNGRMGVAIIAASHVTVTRVIFEKLAISVFDIEPTRSDGGATYVSLTDNVINGYGASPTYTPWVLEGSAYGMTTTIVHDVTLARNRINGMTRSANTGTTGGLRVKAQTQGWKNFSILNNVSTVTGSGPTMYFEHVDGLTVSGNSQPLTRGPLVWFDDSSG